MAPENVRKLIRPTEDKRFPFISLPRALDRARQLYKSANVYEVGVPVAIKSWDYAEKSSGIAQTISALKAFGLLEDQGSGAARKLKLSEVVLKIIRDPRDISPDRDALIRGVALKPSIHKAIIEQFQGSLPPSDEAFKAFLLMDLSLQDAAVGELMREFSETMAFAKIGASDIISPQNEAMSRDDRKRPAIGDLVQWEPAGTLQFPAPHRLVGFTPDGAFAFVEGSATGLPIGELHVTEAVTAPPPKIVAATATIVGKATLKGDAAPTSALPRKLAGWNFEEGGSVEIYVSGDIGTPDALDMVDTLVKMKRDELKRAAKAEM